MKTQNTVSSHIQDQSEANMKRHIHAFKTDRQNFSYFFQLLFQGAGQRKGPPNSHGVIANVGDEEGEMELEEDGSLFSTVAAFGRIESEVGGGAWAASAFCLFLSCGGT